MNFFLFSTSTLLIPFAWGWGWPRTQTSDCGAGASGSVGSCQGSTDASNGTSMQPCPKQMWNISSTGLNESVCWDSMLYQSLNLTNVTAIYQPGSWESEYQKIQDFCSARGNGSFCYQPSSSSDTSSSACLSMAVIRCPEGIVSSCRAGFMCGEIYADKNVTCTWKNMTQWQMNNNQTDSSCAIDKYYNASLFNFTESGQAACLLIGDVLKLPEAVNVTTTTDSQNNTVTVGKQAFGYPFATTTTVDCTMTCVTSLPFSGLPQPTDSLQICYNPTLQYDQLIPKSTCPGPYPPGPMTTVTVCPSERTGMTTSIEESSTIAASTSCEISSSATMYSSPSTTAATACPTSNEQSSVESSAQSSSITSTPSPSAMYNDYGYGQGQGQEQGYQESNNNDQKNNYNRNQYDYSQGNEEDDGYYGGPVDNNYGEQPYQ